MSEAIDFEHYKYTKEIRFIDTSCGKLHPYEHVEIYSADNYLCTNCNLWVDKVKHPSSDKVIFVTRGEDN